jgi:GNAT superfamily N-acetyltransferase
MFETVHIRLPTVEDASHLARLSTDLGYPASESTIISRLKPLLGSPAHRVVVAEIGQRVVGWAGAEVRMTLESDLKVEITGLVVDASARKSGIGRRLVAEIEGWARECGHKVVVVRSNVVRLESHPFYEKLGYERAKTQYAYTRVLQAV